MQAQALRAAAMTRITVAIDTHLIGSALALAEETKMRQRTGLVTDADLREAAGPFLRSLLASGAYPAQAGWLAERAEDEDEDEDGADLDGQLAYTLGCLLDGMSRRA